MRIVKELLSNLASALRGGTTLTPALPAYVAGSSATVSEKAVDPVATSESPVGPSIPELETSAFEKLREAALHGERYAYLTAKEAKVVLDLIGDMYDANR